MLVKPRPLQISSFNWDHNDNFAQFSGCHALLANGYMSVFSKLAEGMDIHYDTVVKRVELMSGGGVRVVDSRGSVFHGDKVSVYSHPTHTHTPNVTAPLLLQVIVTVPLAVLKTNMIKFIPALPERKAQAIRNLGAGLVEKVCVCVCVCTRASAHYLKELTLGC